MENIENYNCRKLLKYEAHSAKANKTARTKPTI